MLLVGSRDTTATRETAWQFLTHVHMDSALTQRSQSWTCTLEKQDLIDKNPYACLYRSCLRSCPKEANREAGTCVYTVGTTQQ